MSIEVADVLDHLAGSPQGRRLLVAVDGVDASGKTTFAGWLAEALRLRGRSAHVIHVDDFMHVRSVRHRRGRNSPEGYFHDSYDYESLTRYVLKPLSVSGDGWFRAGTVDRVDDVVIHGPLQYADAQTITIVEGLFLLRDELVDWWDYSVFLDVDTDAALARKGRRDGLVLNPANPLTRRYVEGQRIYVEGCQPRGRATWVLTNVDSKAARRDA
ncbi:uridine kinase [Dactylosporangium sp. AC04546]|uniref:uridine kinase n=1 Tax=Dactylosporangium sp. AC04546 TaxID=2862460 RepID=UPI001EE0D4A6|nr:uridine kinase [Dactylosporangium sp. AC04546]WVK80609.1 uridine kinase [Dactylosporangium sp. AC04546]